LRIGKLRPPLLCRADRLAEPFGNPGTDRERHGNQACRGRGSHYQESALREERARLDQPKNPWSGICGRLRMAHTSETLQRQIPLGAYDAVLGNKLSISPPYEARTCETRKTPLFYSLLYENAMEINELYPLRCARENKGERKATHWPHSGNRMLRDRRG